MSRFEISKRWLPVAGNADCRAYCGNPGSAEGTQFLGFRTPSTLLLLLFLLADCRHVAVAACNIIPGTTLTFRGALGTTDRPFAGPGDVIELRLSPCDQGSPGFSALGADQVVTLVFSPPNGPSSIVLLARDCTALESRRAVCGATAGVARAGCVPINRPDRPIDLDVVEREGIRRLRIRVPSIAALGGIDGVPEHTLSGPAAIAVTPASDAAPLPCDLATTSCASHSGLLACIDALFAIDGTCGSEPNPTFSHFTILPVPNSYQALCTDPHPPCDGTATEARFTIDTDGNALMPMDWRGILLGQGVPIARQLRGSTSIDASLAVHAPIRIPRKW